MITEEEIKKLGRKNVGFRFSRTKYVDTINPKTINMEKVFSQEWSKINKKHNIWYKYGFLQQLFIETLKITNRDKMITASVIQWLGSNVGFSFLQNVLEKSGYSIVKDNGKVKEANKPKFKCSCGNHTFNHLSHVKAIEFKLVGTKHWYVCTECNKAYWSEYYRLDTENYNK